MYKRICLFGGPGVGKSNFAPLLYSKLDIMGHKVELVREMVKKDAYAGRFPEGFRQLKVFTEQLFSEEDFLPYVDFVVTDSPVIMNATYAKTYGFSGWPEILSLAKQWEEKYPALNILLPRRFEYNPAGRFQSLEQAIEIDEMIKATMIEHLPKESLLFDHYDVDTIAEMIDGDFHAK